MAWTIRDIQESLRKELKSKRFSHTLGVEYTSICLAMKYGEDLKKADLAGLLHDCAKEFSDKKLLKICKKNNEMISETEEKNPFLLHGKAGACVARDVYEVTDETILDAIRYHTTGRPDMSLLEKIVFTADYIEPGRNHAPNLDALRKLAFEDLDRAVYEILEQTLSYLDESGSEIDQQTMITRDFYRKELNL